MFTYCFVDVHRYYTTEFDWNQNVVTIKQCTPLSKFDKWWMGKCMCIEGMYMCICRCTYMRGFTIAVSKRTWENVPINTKFFISCYITALERYMNMHCHKGKCVHI